MLRQQLFRLSLALFALWGPGFILSAQTSRGTLTGTINDISDASVPSATVEIVNQLTGITRRSTTNQAGFYQFDAVDLGMYNMTIRAPGFRSYNARGISVQAAQTASVNAVLEIGEAASAIDVDASAAPLQTETPVRGGNISAVAITRLPFASRNPNLLAVTLPGVTENRANLPGTATYSVNGSRGRSNNFLLDGTENNDISVAGQAFQVRNPDTVQEVSVQTSNYDAEFGRAGGAVVNTITNSGTNSFHGTLGWLADFTNDDAISSQSSASELIRARGKLLPGYDQYYNGTLGGPVKRDRTFFFLSWQEQRQHGTMPQPINTLSARGRQQLSSAFPRGQNPRADLYLDVTKDVDATANLSVIDLGPGRGTAEFGMGVLAYRASYLGRQTLDRVDHHFSEKDLLSLRYGYDRGSNPNGGLNANSLSYPAFFTSLQQRNHNVVLTETHIFSPTLTNELRLPYNRILFEYPADAPDPRAATLPRVMFAGLDALGVPTGYPQGRVANNFVLQDTVNWIHGRHAVRFGLDLLKQRSRQAAPFAVRGALGYASSSIAGGQSYSQFANFLDDFGGSNGVVTRDFGDPTFYPELFRQAYFLQDRWQIRDNFTLTLGLRWEDFGLPMNSVRTAAYAGIFNVKVDSATRTVTAPFSLPNKVEADRNNFSPVIGLTYSPRFQEGILGRLFGNQKSVIRTGYHIGYDSFFNNMASNAAASSPNLISTSTVSSVSAQNPRGLANLSQQLPLTPRALSPTDLSILIDRNLRNPYYQRWSFGIQRELPWGLLLDTSYVGSSGTRLFLQEDLNPMVANAARRVLPAGFSSLAELQAVVPYTLQPRLDPLQGDRSTRTNNGHSSYHSGQFQLRKRFTADLGFSAAYTWSKLLDNGSEIFAYNNSPQIAAIPTPFGGGYLEKAVSLYDRPYRLAVTFHYSIPFLRASRGFASHVFGGWQIAGITTVESGVPFNVTNGADADGIGGSNDRPDVNPAGKAGVRAVPVPNTTSPTGYVNPDVLDSSNRSVPINPAEARYIGLPTGAGRTGNAGRNLERTPGLRNIDANLFKRFRLSEKVGLEFRTEFYNLLNHTQYGFPSVSPFTSFVTTPASNVNGSLQGRFLNFTQLDGGARTIRYQLTLRF